MVKQLRRWLLVVGIFEGGVITVPDSGTPQGSRISRLLANIALHRLDRAWQAAGPRAGTLVRYADDFVVVCATPLKPSGPSGGRRRSWPSSGSR